jgi:hypothetical protein
VPLKAVNWSWWGFATNANGGGLSGWEKGGGNNSINPPDYPTENYPFWRSKVSMSRNDIHLRQ